MMIVCADMCRSCHIDGLNILFTEVELDRDIVNRQTVWWLSLTRATVAN